MLKMKQKDYIENKMKLQLDTETNKHLETIKSLKILKLNKTVEKK